jgi:hypothetical protein
MIRSRLLFLLLLLAYLLHRLPILPEFLIYSVNSCTQDKKIWHAKPPREKKSLRLCVNLV